MTLKPKRLCQGNTVGIVAPAGPGYDTDTTRKGIDVIKSMGFNVKEGNTVYRANGYLSGTDYERAEDINRFFENKSIDGIICLRGGYGALRILEMIDYDIIKKNPKVFVGYSDITAVHCAIYRFCNLVTFHGPMVYSDMGSAADKITMESFIKNITVSEPVGKIKNPAGMPGINVLCKGEAKGKLTGGNLSVIVSALGTKYEIDTKDRILLLEDIGEEPYRIDRMLTQLLMSGKLECCSGVVLGQWTECNARYPERSLSLEEVFYDRLSHLGIPVLYNLAVGHGDTKLTIPLGVKSRITYDGELIIEEQGVV